jgi:hypothetical protein
MMVKILLTNEEYELLKELKEELKKQDNRITYMPIYGIMKKIKVWGVDREYSDGSEFLIDDTTYDEEGLLEYMVDNYCDELIDQASADEFKFEATDHYERAEEYYKSLKSYEIDDILEDLTDGYRVYYRFENDIHNNSFSFFEKDAYDHLRLNGHNISGKKHTYAFSNQRTPRMEKLRNFLKNINCFGVYAKEVHR